jgi:hypothetical protein
MTTTFGDLVDVADRHLLAAARTDLSALPPPERMQAMTALGGCVRAVHLLWRTADRPDRPFRDYDSAWNRAGRELSAGLTEASRCLARLGDTSEPSSWCAPAQHLLAAGVAIGAGHDLLATHTTLTPNGPFDRTGVSAVIDSPDGRRAVAEACARHLPLLARMAEALVEVDGAKRPAREAALRASEGLYRSDRAIANAGLLTRLRPDLLPGIRVVDPLRLQPVRDNESPDELLREAVNGIGRLHRVALEELSVGRIERHSPGAMATVSVAMAVTHGVSSRLLGHIAPVADVAIEGAARHEHQQGLREAARASERSADAWASVREAWRGIRGLREHGPPDVLRAEASDLTTRVGRLAHSDPAWLPKVGASHELRPASELCPNPATTARLVQGLRELAVGSWLLAHDHGRMVSMHEGRMDLLVPTRSLTMDADVPRPWFAAPPHRVDAIRCALSEAWASAHDVSRLLETGREEHQALLTIGRSQVGRPEGRARTM